MERAVLKNKIKIFPPSLQMETWHMCSGASGGHLKNEENETAQTKVPPSPAFYSHVETCQTRDIFSSEHWLLRRSCLDETEGVGEGQYVFMHLAKSRKVHFWDFIYFFVVV